MKKLFYIIIANVLVFGACAKYEFEKSAQNVADFQKVISIGDLVYLHNNSSQPIFAKQLNVEGTVVGRFGNYIFITDNSGYGLRVQVKNSNSFLIGELVRIAVGGLSIESNHQFFDLTGISEPTKVGEGLVSPSIITLDELVSNLLIYSSRLITISDLTNIKFFNTGDEGKYYSFISGEKSALLFIPDSLFYQVPEELVSVTGFLRIKDGTLVLNIRTLEDIKEVYVEPLMIEKIMNSSGLVKSLVQNSEIEVAPGVKFAQFSYINTDDLVTSGSLFEIDLNNPNVKIEGGSPNDAPPPYSAIQTLATMASHKNNNYANTGWRVLAAMTGDFYNANIPYTLNGPFVRNGVILKSDFTSTSDQFFGVLKNREGFVVGGRVDFDLVKNNLEHAVGGRVILRNGNIVEVNAIREPRPAIGYTKNNKVYMFIGNGRLLSVSNGFTPVELSHLMKSLGCEGAVYLNGGGATVGVLENQDGVYEKFSHSHATNLNHNPSLASAWMILTKR